MGHIARADPSQDHSRAFRQPSTVFQPTGAAGEADHVEPGSVPSSLTCNRPTLASTRRGFAHNIVPNGVQLWRRLCSPLGVPSDDDDDSILFCCLRRNVEPCCHTHDSRTIVTVYSERPRLVGLALYTVTENRDCV